MNWHYARNNSSTILVNAVDASTTSIEVSSGADLHGSSPVFPYWATIWDIGVSADPSGDPNMEIVEVIYAEGNVLSVNRGADGTSAKSHKAGSVIARLINAGYFNEIQNNVDSVNDSILGIQESVDELEEDVSNLSNAVNSLDNEVDNLSNAVNTVNNSSNSHISNYNNPHNVTYSQLTMSSPKVLGRFSSGSGAVEELPITGTGSNVVTDYNPRIDGVLAINMTKSGNVGTAIDVLGTSTTGARLTLRVPEEAVGNLVNYQSVVGTSTVSNYNSLGGYRYIITQADPNPLKSKFEILVNTGDNALVALRINDNRTAEFASTVKASGFSTGTATWTLGSYSSDSVTATGYVTITINGVTYRLLAATE